MEWTVGFGQRAVCSAQRVGSADGPSVAGAQCGWEGGGRRCAAWAGCGAAQGADLTDFTADQLRSGLDVRGQDDLARSGRNADAIAKYFSEVDDAPKIATNLLSGVLMLAEAEVQRHFELGDLLRHNSPRPLGQAELIELVFACEVRPDSVRPSAWRIVVAEPTALGHAGDGAAARVPARPRQPAIVDLGGRELETW